MENIQTIKDANDDMEIQCYCAKAKPIDVYSNSPDGIFSLCKGYFVHKAVNLFM